MKTVSHSEVDSFLLCQRKHWYGYHRGLDRKQSSDSLVRGTTGHSMLETYYSEILKGTNKTEAHFAAVGVLMSLDIDTTIRTELMLLLNVLHQHDPFDDYEILAVEKEFVLNVDDEFEYPFVVDMLVRDKHGRIAAVDHKFVASFYSSRDIDMMSQLPKYIGALRAKGMPVDYAIYNMLRHSQAKTWSPDNQHDTDKLLQVLTFEPNDHRIQTTFREQVETSRQILALEHTEDGPPRVQNKLVCNSCPFLSLCVAELNGYNSELIVRSEYKKRERRTFNVN